MVTLIKGIDTKFVEEGSSLLPILLAQGWSVVEEKVEEKAVEPTQKKGVKNGISSTTGS